MSKQNSSAAASGTFLIGGDMPVHRLGYGTMRLVGDGAWGEPDDAAEARRVLRRAVALGVTLVDTADAYGPEIAERLIGEALYPYAGGVVIATKGGITRQGPAKTEYVGRAGYLIQCVEMSLRRLRLEQIDLYQLHRIDPRTPLEESLGALRRMQEQGKIRHIGLSEVTPAEIEEAGKIVKVTLSRIDTVWPTGGMRRRWHTARSTESGFCPGIRLRAASCSSRNIPRRRRWRGLLLGIRRRWLSFRWRGCLQRSPVMLPIPGTSKVAHLEENVAAAGLKLSAEEWDELEKAAL